MQEKDGAATGRKASNHDLILLIAGRIFRTAENPSRATYTEMAKAAAALGYTATTDGSTVVLTHQDGSTVRISGERIKAEVNRLIRNRHARVMSARR